MDVRFSRPVKSTIATALLRVAQKEGIQIAKSDLESMCEQNGNDIRAILNGLDFNKSGDISNKDSTLRLDLFSATQKLIGNTRCSLDESANLVAVDYGMVPLMVSEAYINSSKDSLENVIAAADMLSIGDMIDRRIHTKHDWALLPNYMMQIVGAARTVKGPAPFQIFPSWLGKNSKRLKHKRWVEEIGQKIRCSPTCCRLDFMDSIQHILLDGLASGTTDIKSTIAVLDELGLSRDDLMETISEISLEKVEVPTRIKTAFTREYNKTHNRNR